jgi:hypothetical protein
MKGRKLVLILAVIVLVLAVGLLWVFLFGDENPVGKKIIDIADSVGVDVYYGENPEQNMTTIKEKLIGLTADSGEGGSGGDSVSKGGSGDNCQMIQIAYSLKNFEKEKACIESGPSGCTNLAINCSMDVYHEDSKADGGDFSIRFEVLDSNDVLLDDSLVTKYLEYGEFLSFDAEFNIIDYGGVDETSDCTFDSEVIPRREYCG